MSREIPSPAETGRVISHVAWPTQRLDCKLLAHLHNWWMLPGVGGAYVACVLPWCKISGCCLLAVGSHAKLDAAHIFAYKYSS